MASRHSKHLLLGAVLMAVALSHAGAASASAVARTAPHRLTSTPPPKEKKADQSDTSSREEPSEDKPVSKEKTKTSDEQAEKPESDVAQVEVYLPSVKKLVEAAKRSKTAALFAGLSDMVVVPQKETDKGLDTDALLSLFKQIEDWPDTSITLTTFTQDREGRARWAIQVDWPLDELRKRLQGLLDDEKAKTLFKDIRMARTDDGSYQLKLPDFDLAVLRKSSDGSMLLSNADLKVPETVFGRKSGAAAKKKTSTLVYCRLNLEAGGEGGGSAFNALSGVRDIKYAAKLSKDGRWSEKFGLSWNPLIGMAIKAAVSKVEKTFQCPKDCYASAAINLGSEGLADSLAGLPPATIGPRVRSEMAVAVVPGTGFLPFPDLFYQLHTRGKDKIVEAIREAMRKDTDRRKADDLPPAWKEGTADGRVFFWRDPSADGGGSFLMPATYRTVLFFAKTDDDSAKPNLIIANTTTSAADAVTRWNELTQSGVEPMPDGEDAHWQARIRWRSVYALAQPYLSVLSGFTEGASLPPTDADLKDVLVDSRLDVTISYNGVLLTHEGPIPLGAGYVPVATIMSLSATDDPSSEAERERVACQNLRVLYHHAKLFEKDYGRWPATVAELDGYVDFASHPHLLWLRGQDRGMFGNIAAGLIRRQPKPDANIDRAIDDSLYNINWSPDDWKLNIRDGEFKNYQTIYIDAKGAIHRTPKAKKEVASKTE